MEESGLGVLLRYMNGSAGPIRVGSPSSTSSPAGAAESWVALRTVAELAFISSPTTSHASHPLLRVAASCGFLRSHDAFLGDSYPLLYACSDLQQASRPSTRQPIAPFPPTAAVTRSPPLPRSATTSPQSEQRKTLVEEFVAQVMLDAQQKGGSSPSRYPALEALERATVEQQRLGLTPPPLVPAKSSAPQPAAVLSHAPHPATATTTTSAAASSTCFRYPLTQAVASAAARKHLHPTLFAYADAVERASRSVFNLFDSDDEGDDDDEEVVPQVRNTAFLFIKPHAFGRPVQQLVERRMKEAGLQVDRCGVITTDRVDSEGIVDRHYAAIARYATMWPAERISLSAGSKQTFQATFGESWDAAVAAGKVLNAKQAAHKYRTTSGAAFAAIWNRHPSRVKLAPGLYVGHFKEEDSDLYVINGFYLANREKFTAAGGHISWYVVSWDSKAMPWRDFRGLFVGSTNPNEAALGSLRREILDHWKTLGLLAPPTVSDNGVHASAGPLEGLAERLIWLAKHTMARDVFGRALAHRRVAPVFVSTLLDNPVVEVRGKKGLVFDLLEDWDSVDVIDALYEVQQEKVSQPNEDGVRQLSALEVLKSLATPTEKRLQLAIQCSEASRAPPPKPHSAVPHVGPMPPTHVRPKPPPRALSSPYLYHTRSCGAGLESVFEHTLRLLGSKRFAKTAVTIAAATSLDPQVVVKRAFFGLHALHAAAIEIKSSSSPDPLLSLTTLSWSPLTSYVEMKGAVAIPAPPSTRIAAAASVRRPPLSNTAWHTMTSSSASAPGGTAEGGDDTIPLPMSARLSTADRIKRRTAKLQEEIAELDRRREERAKQHHRGPNAALFGAKSPRAGPRRVWNSPRKPNDADDVNTIVQSTMSPRVPAKPHVSKHATRPGAGGAGLPVLGIKPEQVKLQSLIER